MQIRTLKSHVSKSSKTYLITLRIQSTPMVMFSGMSSCTLMEYYNLNLVLPHELVGLMMLSNLHTTKRLALIFIFYTF